MVNEPPSAPGHYGNNRKDGQHGHASDAESSHSTAVADTAIKGSQSDGHDPKDIKIATLEAANKELQDENAALKLIIDQLRRETETTKKQAAKGCFSKKENVEKAAKAAREMQEPSSKMAQVAWAAERPLLACGMYENVAVLGDFGPCSA
ncbi:hypothetical protein BKA81DRAFT_382408 [Phyllosticta paracitricarpa]